MIELHLIIDTMLPCDPELGMPSSSSVNFDAYLVDRNISNVAFEFITMLDKICIKKFSLSFIDLNEEQRMKAINACKLENVKLFSFFVECLLKFYYTNNNVLNKIGAGSVPPFPNGNLLKQDDWSILESVYERGKIYRDA